MKNIRSSYNNNKFKISAPTWNDKFELPDESYYVSDIQDYFEYILKKHGENTDNPSVQIYVNKIENYAINKMFVPDKPFGSLLEISAINHIFLKAFNSGFQDIVV